MTPSSELAILVPVLNRPQNVEPLLESIMATAPSELTMFLPDVGDHAELRAIADAGIALIERRPSGTGYAAKINHGIRSTAEPLIFLAADDLEFQSGWLEAAKAKLAEGFEVVGVNDLIDRPHRRHATHFLVTRGYAQQGQADGEPGLLHEGYDHSFVDDELIATAQARGVYAYAEDSHVKHLHPINGTAPDDDTYRKGRENFRRDRNRFFHRSPLWA